MRTGFMNEPDDVQWLKDTALKGVPLPSAYSGFASFILQGNEDGPFAVNLYRKQDPHFADNYFRIRFTREAPEYCTGCEYDGNTDRPLGNLSEV